MNINKIIGNDVVSLEEMLKARENRADLQHRLLAIHGLPIICFTLNIAGQVKLFPLARKTFNEGKKLILRQLERLNCGLVSYNEIIEKTGCEGFFVVDKDPFFIKRLTVAIEDNLPICRLFDIDVIKVDGEKVSREDIGYMQRRCLVCHNPAPQCARSRAHSLEELTRYSVRIMQDYFNYQYADSISQIANRALLYEVCTTPKPGLVDQNNSGAHKDMDIFTFLDGSAALIPYFREFTLKGLRYDGDDVEKLFFSIRYMGQQAEDAMFYATNNINTHKGLIFSLGIICTALGYLHGRNAPTYTDTLLNLCKEMTARVIEKDFADITLQNCKTNGERLFAKYGISGIRGEAASGFASVRKYGLPMLKQMIAKGYSLNDSGAITLLNLIANVQDTNIIARSNMDVQKKIQSEISSLLKNEALNEALFDQEDAVINSENILTYIYDTDSYFIEKNISPGGCADLLAITYMLHFLEQSGVYSST
jgi:holo-ACP synthase/triphosphoribosyl-dephospho-CoA synthase